MQICADNMKRPLLKAMIHQFFLDVIRPFLSIMLMGDDIHQRRGHINDQKIFHGLFFTENPVSQMVNNIEKAVIAV